MPIPLIAGLIAGVANAGSQVANYFINERQIEKQNRYNSPAAQVQRLHAAGINPYAAVSQIASNNQGITNRSDFDFGKSVGLVGDIYSKLTSSQISKEQNELYMQKLREQITGLQLKNQLSREAYDYNLQLINYKSQKAFFDMLYSSGKLDRQNYDNVVAFINSEFAKYQSGQYSDLFGSAVWESVDSDGYTVEEPRIPMRDVYNSRWSQAMYDMMLKRDTLGYKTEYERLKNLKTEADYKHAVIDFLRDSIALRYEQHTNMPWQNKDPWIHFLEPVITNLARLIFQLPPGATWQDVWDNIEFEDFY